MKNLQLSVFLFAMSYAVSASVLQRRLEFTEAMVRTSV